MFPLCDDVDVQRDADFRASVRRELAARAGHRCSNPTCRLPTSRPSPEDSDKSVSGGKASHITAASPNGPRYDETLSPAERRGIGNGIWLCDGCARTVDDSPNAYTRDGLQAWKQHAEAAAARDANVRVDQVGPLLSDIQSAHDRLLAFATRWQAGEPLASWTSARSSLPSNRGNAFEFALHTEAVIAYSTRRNDRYQIEIAPLIYSIAIRAEIILGPRSSVVEDLKLHELIGPTNYLGMRELAKQLQRLRQSLLFR